MSTFLKALLGADFNRIADRDLRIKECASEVR
jgi:hypothetical protein